jgi:hypothetical protein
MAEEPPEVKPDPTPEQLTEHRLPDPCTPGERETFIARVEELLAENKALKAELAEARKARKASTSLDRFCPL